jgi:hypothetical protein
MTAAVRGVIASWTPDAVISSVAGLTSTNTGLAPTANTASAVAMNVLAGTMTSSPGPMPSAARLSWRAAVPLATPTPCRTPQ